MEVIGNKPTAGNIDLGDERDSPPEPFLKRLDPRKKPARLPEVRLSREADQARFRNGPPRESSLSVICRRIFGSLHKLLELSTEDVVHLQLPGNLFGDIHTMRATRIEIRLLQDENVCICTCKEINDARQLQATVDVPVDNAQRTGRPGEPTHRRKVTRKYFLHCHTYTLAAQA